MRAMVGILFLGSLVVMALIDFVRPADSIEEPTAPFTGTALRTANEGPAEEIEYAGGTKKL